MFKPSVISLAIASALVSPSAIYAKEISAEKSIEVIQISATRRKGTVQEAPLNITALDSDVMKEQNIGELADIARWVPGLTVTDQGGRSGSPIIVRGLNTNSSGPGSDGGTVATYINEIPVAIDMRLTDVERVEVLIGPQGTLYGAGTLGGAIRYMLNAPQLDVTSGEVYAETFSVNESENLGGETGAIFNFPLIEDTLAIRASLNHFNDPGFIDYAYVVKEGGVSQPDPDWINPDAVSENLKTIEDANGEKTTTGRISLRWQPAEWFESTLNYFYQKQKSEGRSIVHHNALHSDNGVRRELGVFESAYRYEEPRDKEDTLLSLELNADLGFAELVSATGLSTFEAVGQRDQTDLLIRLNYGYEEFPSFSVFTREESKVDTFTQEIRLVSQCDSPLNWIVGGFYNKSESDGFSKEFTPGYADFLEVNRPDDLEYYSVDKSEITEQALFGEIGYAINEKLNVTIGARFYEYEVDAGSAVDFPLANTAFSGADPDAINLNFKSSDAKDNGSLFKANINYQFNDDILTYATVSEGFRIGGSNSLIPCPEPLPDKQIGCGKPHEMLYTADTTVNYELGLKSTWLRNKVHFNAAIFNVDWQDAQIAGATEVGQLPYTSNAGTANAKGIEISSRAILSNSLTAYATYAYTKVQLTSDAPTLFNSDGTDGGLDGDRLPGSPQKQFSLGLNYQTEIFNDKQLDFNYGLTAQSDVISKVGLHAHGETLPGYALSNLSTKVAADTWAVTIYIDNLFDKYAYTSVRRDKSDITTANGAQIQRNYGHYITKPRTIGLQFNYSFEL